MKQSILFLLILLLLVASCHGILFQSAYVNYTLRDIDEVTEQPTECACRLRCFVRVVCSAYTILPTATGVLCKSSLSSGDPVTLVAFQNATTFCRVRVLFDTTSTAVISSLAGVQTIS